ncbi:hypothetical protein [Hymenobacter sp. B81]|uniref:hypothetical protein n=1 Tax=Hymenobacter sp. B81 TaxID=3344878 RepID=UPI0037DD0C3C
MLFTAILPRLRFSLLAVTLLLVVGLNNQAVATFRAAPAKANVPQLQGAPKGTVVKQKVTLEATASLAPWLLPAVDGWLPPAPEARLFATYRPQPAAPRPRPEARPNWFGARLLGSALSPHAP